MTAIIFLLVLLNLGLPGLFVIAEPAARETPPAAAAEERLAAIHRAALAADYRADLDELARQRDAAMTLAADRELGYAAHYWAGFAEWRIAINGVNRGMKGREIAGHLERAAASMESSIDMRPDFADAHAALASIEGWLAMIVLPRDEATGRAHWVRSSERLKKARALGPGNPRVLWVWGGVHLFTPKDQGGSVDRAIEIYTEMLAAARAENAASPVLPHWGEPEARMSLAYAHLQNQNAERALAEAREALRLAPEWAYVRDVLIPQIEATRAK